jgi:STE24 endopeptidase
MPNLRSAAAGLVVFAVIVSSARGAGAESAPPPRPPLVELGPIPPAAVAPTDAMAATRAYLDTLSPQARAGSDAYFEGGYWLILWNFVVGSAISLILLFSGASAKMRDYASRISRRRPLQAAVYWVQYLLVTALLGFPLAMYQGYYREHDYGLSNMTFGAWLGDEGKGLVVGIILGGIGMMILYFILARAKRTWWAWGTAAAVVFATFAIAIAPIYIEPLFNKYTPLADSRVKDPILSMARANGITGVKDVLEVDASRQSKRVSANVAGLFGTERIALNDNLLARCSLPEIKAVMGHEMGHYVLHHVFHGIAEIALVILLAFGFVRWGFERLRLRFAARWKVAGVDDPAGLPLFALLFTTFFFFMTPVVNSLVRTQEADADIFGLNAAREPDGFAQVALKLSEYRKLDPGPLEEIIFYDHPSGRNRILMAMRWKVEQLKQQSPSPTDK